MKGLVFLTRLCAAALAVLVLAVALIGTLGGRFNRTASHPIGLYWRVNEEPKIGLYAEFCIPAPRNALPPLDDVYAAPCTADRDGLRLLKRIIAIDEERGAYTVQGDDPRSLDSRIFGPLTRADIHHVLIPIWTTPRTHPQRTEGAAS